MVDGWRQTTAQRSDYIVQKGDTVYSIAWAYGMDYRDIVKANHLPPACTIHVGQKLKMQMGKESAAPRPVIVKNTNNKPVKVHSSVKPKPTLPTATAPARPTRACTFAWAWPTQGKILKSFSLAQGGNHGIDIGGRLSQSIKAGAAGKVVYAGSGLRGYGRLIIIKHNDSYLSAYAFNKVLLVKEGANVKAGQVIAQMGQDDSGRNLLHFEIRQNGRPVNPMYYLPKI